MPRATTPLALLAATALTIGLAGCSGSAAGDDAAADSGFAPITIEHALGTTTIESAPERVATVNWANHEVPLALGVVPVGMAAANFGDDDGDGLLPWVSEKLDELGAETPVLFDETDGIDFEAVSDTDPDVILAAYSGLTQEDYDTLSEIAPVVAYPETAWGTSWRDMITLNSEAMGRADEGAALITELEGEIEEKVAAHPQLAGTSAMFLTHVDPTDLSQVSFYTSHDTRPAFFEDLGMATPGSIATASAATDKFSLTQSAEQADAFSDVDVIVTYGDDELVSTLKADPLLSQIPAVADDAIVRLPSTPLGTAANPTPLSISWVLDDYLDLLDEAAAKAAQSTPAA
ncbi:ABC transporter substrate-binding protein [Rathayibacter sp. AY1C2]|jgi:iron complex transport system substrate-binding protein|uniref:iron-siderophore ABC transporter substrate-binding protein n=1 Tax=unclassified Rathayibacter TaxID=2609250 RepID=UPI000CE90020|nr:MULTISPECIES: iron-siderophore ABC transporter substrate-binding protein [unclassified Rathayibacter]PPF53468.1 ABC transporter substrate-binding protein [Rathayibacter sp. AY1C2]PPF73001.1 ABC transporter substrate-binding protein [Rathayibacter sp. AY1E6]